MPQFEVKIRIFLKLLILGAILFSLIFVFEEEGELQRISTDLYEFPSTSPFIDFSKKSQPETPAFLALESAFLSPNIPSYVIFPKVYAQIISGEIPNNEILRHQVKKGESLSSIAKEYGLKIETIIWANDLRNEIIKEGQELIILPVDGVLHIVKEGETLKDIVEKYNANLEEVLTFNELILPSEVFEGQVLTIPGGKLSEIPKLQKTPLALSTNNFYGQSHSYPFGYCTWWVAQKRKIPALGHAKDWLLNALSLGMAVCFGKDCQPEVGAVVSLKTRHSLGHVAYVEEVKDGKIVISEMNYVNFGVVNKRTLRIGDSRILGYIY